MGFFITAAMFLSVLKEAWSIFNQGKLEKYASLASKTKEERTKGEEDIVIAVGGMTLLAFAINIMSVSALIALTLQEAFRGIGGIALALFMLKFVLLQFLPKVARPAYNICSSVSLIVLYGALIYTGLFA